jgi:hypothetical protein
MNVPFDEQLQGEGYRLDFHPATNRYSLYAPGGRYLSEVVTKDEGSMRAWEHRQGVRPTINPAVQSAAADLSRTLLGLQPSVASLIDVMRYASILLHTLRLAGVIDPIEPQEAEPVTETSNTPEYKMDADYPSPGTVSKPDFTQADDLIYIFQTHNANFFTGYDALVNLSHEARERIDTALHALPAFSGTPSVRDALGTLRAGFALYKFPFEESAGNLPNKWMSIDYDRMGWQIIGKGLEITRCTFWYKPLRFLDGKLQTPPRFWLPASSDLIAGYKSFEGVDL